LTKELVLQESDLLKRAVRKLGKIDEAGYLKVSWPAVSKRLMSKGIPRQGKSCRLRCDLTNESYACLTLHSFH